MKFLKYIGRLLQTAAVSLVVSYFVVYSITGFGVGATVTTINATDTLSNSRSVINTNFSNINTDLEATIATTSMAGLTSAANLATIGTITTGTWNADVLTATYGGTGSSTLASNNVLLGNGTGNIGIVSGHGSSGQFLTSNGAGSAPTWTTSAIDQTASYNFTGTTFRVKNLHASSTSANPLVLNGVSWVWPSSDTASSSVLVSDGSGNLSLNRRTSIFLSSTTPGILPTGVSSASTTIFTYAIPANTLSYDNELLFEMPLTMRENNSTLHVEVGFGSASTTFAIVSTTGSTDTYGEAYVQINGRNSKNSQRVTVGVEGRVNELTVGGLKSATFSQDSTSVLYVTLIVRSTDTGWSFVPHQLIGKITSADF